MLHPDVNNDASGKPQTAPHPAWPEPAYERIPYQPAPQAYQSTPGIPSYPPSPEEYQATQEASDATEEQPILHSPMPEPSDRYVPPTGTYVPPTRARGRGLRTGAIIALTLAILLVFGVGLFAGWEFGQNSANSAATLPPLQATGNPHANIPALNGSNVDTVREAVVASVKPAVVEVKTQSGLGSGVIVDKRGYIVTNNHVVASANGGRIDVVLSDGSTQSNVKLVGTDPADDLAVLKINPPANMVTATLGDSSKLQVGQSVLAIGNPLGITQTVTSGIISALNRNVDEQNGAAIQNAIQTDAPINPGNSGGALVDLQGELIGIPTLTAVDPEFNAPAAGVGFAIPSNRVSFIVEQIIKDGKVTHTGRAAIGVYSTDVNANVEALDNLSVDHGALILRLVNNGPAAQAGLQVGDVIVQIDNDAIDNTSSLADALMTKTPNQKVTVKVYRGNQQLTVTVTLGELQAGS